MSLHSSKHNNSMAQATGISVDSDVGWTLAEYQVRAMQRLVDDGTLTPPQRAALSETVRLSRLTASDIEAKLADEMQRIVALKYDHESGTSRLDGRGWAAETVRHHMKRALKAELAKFHAVLRTGGVQEEVVRPFSAARGGDDDDEAMGNKGNDDEDDHAMGNMGKDEGNDEGT